MSDWYWRVIAIKALFVLSCFVCYHRAENTIPKLPFCNPNPERDASANNDLVIVSTIDGRLTAFSTDNGIQAWAVDTQSLLSSNLQHVELTSGGKWLRLIPSLRGTLYSLSGDTIEPLPFDAEQLLSSSFKYSDDLVMAGARETIWLGLDLRSGRVIYECGSSGCNSAQQTLRDTRDVLVLRRNSNTVRALDPRSGVEKWNFSVAEHQLALSRRECVGGEGPPARVVLAAALPDGVVAVRAADTHAVMWQHKLDAPVVDMWRLQGGVLEHMNILLEAARGFTDVANSAPSLYLGVHNSQLYIQESPLYSRKLETAVSSKPLPWKLRQSRPLLTNGDKAITALQDDQNTLSQVVLYGTTGRQDNHGFFLYLPDSVDHVDQAVQVNEDSISGPDTILPNSSGDHHHHHHVHVHVYSLWFWWKEVLLITVSSALLMNLMIWPRFFAPKLRVTTPLPIYERPPAVAKPQYCGRYESDFTPVRCLGSGGFGVVFEAKNKIDDRPYAVKRIALPRRESKRERVLREVRALAKLEHENIVRYFNAWLEEPPPMWQEMRDAIWKRELEGARNIEDSIDTMDNEKKISGPKRLRSLSCNGSLSTVFEDTNKHTSDITIPSKHLGSGDVDDDSFVVFANTQSGSAQIEVTNKRLDKVKESEEYVKTASSAHSKKKKKHTRHWSLDMCVNNSKTLESVEGGVKMYLYIQMQLCRRDSLHDWLRQNRTTQSRRETVNTLFSQITSAVEYVHLAGLIHRDLKPSNIFFALDGKVKVGDFGLVTDISQYEATRQQELNVYARHTHKVGTHLYMSPEQVVGRPYGYKVDIYSLGLVLFELLQPFATEMERVNCLVQLRAGRFPDNFHHTYPNEMEVLKLMLSEDPSQRPTASGVRARAPLYQATDDRWHFTLPALLS